MEDKIEENKLIVVVADDDAIVLRQVMSMLNDLYVVRPFPSGETALKFLERNEADIILLDHNMPPHKSGIEILEILQKDEKLSQIPVIFLTSEVCPETETEALQKGAIDYVCKPINREILTHRIALALDLKKDELSEETIDMCINEINDLI